MHARLNHQEKFLDEIFSLDNVLLAFERSCFRVSNRTNLCGSRLAAATLRAGYQPSTADDPVQNNPALVNCSAAP